MSLKSKIKAWCLRRRVFRTLIKDIDAKIDLGKLEISETPQGPLINLEYELIPEAELTLDAVHVSGQTRDYVNVAAVVSKYPRTAVMSGMTAHDFYTLFMDDTIREAVDDLAKHASKEGQTDIIRIVIYAGIAITIALFLMLKVWS